MSNLRLLCVSWRSSCVFLQNSLLSGLDGWLAVFTCVSMIRLQQYFFLIATCGCGYRFSAGEEEEEQEEEAEVEEKEEK